VLASKAKWSVGVSDEAIVQRLVDELRVDPLLARLLVARGITDNEQVQALLSEDEGHFYDPFLLDGMKLAVERIRLALTRKEKIRIYGDYDADGVSSTSLMFHLLTQLEAEFDYYIPHRVNEGYGLNNQAIDHAKKHGVSLIITVDTGISAVEEIAYATSLGLEVIVTDHHEPPERLPEALALINPKKPGCAYPFKALAGVGVAFKLAHALLGRLPKELAEIAAIGTIADLMPLQDENRRLVRMGLKQMQRTQSPGIRALLSIAGASGKEISSSHIAFGLAPRINASGRLEHAGDAVRLLTTRSEQEAEHLAFELDQLNRERQRIVEEVTRLALEQMEQEGLHNRKVLVLYGEDWNVGVVGIVASKLLERYYRPTIILSIDSETGMAKGSARSIAGFDMYSALTHCAEYLDHYGGHQAAAGMSLSKHSIAAFADRLERLAEEWLTEEHFVPMLEVDLECRISEVSVDAIERLDILAPFGNGNPAPRMILSGMHIQELRTMGREQQHLKLTLGEAASESSDRLEALVFGRGGLNGCISTTAKVDVVGELTVNEWNGTKRPQMIVQDLRIPEVQVFDWRGTNEPLEKLTRWKKQQEENQSGASKRILPKVLIDTEDESRIRSLANQGFSVARIDAEDAGKPNISDLFICSLPERLQLLVDEISQYPNLERIYVLYSENDSAKSPGGRHLPSREQFKSLYQAIRQNTIWSMSETKQLDGLSRRTGLSVPWIRFILGVFEELEFVVREGNVYRVVQAPAKKELSASASYRQQAERAEVEKVLLYATSRQLTDWILAQLQPQK
jgi:single-stranded-DNA-specific exonuclease